MENFGNAKHICGMHSNRERSNECIYLSQFEYVCKILMKVNMESAKPLRTSLSMHVKLSKDECPKFEDKKEFMSKIPYHSVVGSLMYAMIATRSDIAFVEGAVSIFHILPIHVANISCKAYPVGPIGFIDAHQHKLLEEKMDLGFCCKMPFLSYILSRIGIGFSVQ